MSEDNSPRTASRGKRGDGGGGVQTKAKRTHNPVTIPTHIQILSEGPNTMYECTPCGKKFKTKYNIKYHAYCLNKDGDKPFKCSQCGKGFVSQSHYQYHLRVHTKELPYPCSQCGKRFNQRSKLTRHQKFVHSRERPFACEQCNKTFTTKEILQNHTRLHTGERPFPCKICEKRFNSRTNLRKHTLLHTGERPFICEECGKSFARKWKLDLHLATHPGRQPFACDQCAMTFEHKYQLLRHCLIHVNIKPWKCLVCDREFRRKDNLKRHIKTRHSVVKRDGQQAELLKLANKSAAKCRKGRLKSAPKPVPVVNSLAKMETTRTSTASSSIPSYQSSSNACAYATLNPSVNNTSVIMLATPVVFVHNLAGINVTNIYCQTSLQDDQAIETIPEHINQTVVQNKDSFKKHSETRSGPPNECANSPFVCPECYYKFATNEELWAHAQLHLLDKSFACNLCSKRFSYYSCLQSHLAATHANNRRASGELTLPSLQNEQVVHDIMPSTSGETGISPDFPLDTPLVNETTILQEEEPSQEIVGCSAPENTGNELAWCHALVSAVHATEIQYE